LKTARYWILALSGLVGMSLPIISAGRLARQKSSQLRSSDIA